MIPVSVSKVSKRVKPASAMASDKKLVGMMISFTTCTTPFCVRLSALVTSAAFTYTAPSEEVMNSSSPESAVTFPAANRSPLVKAAEPME